MKVHMTKQKVSTALMIITLTLLVSLAAGLPILGFVAYWMSPDYEFAEKLGFTILMSILVGAVPISVVGIALMDDYPKVKAPKKKDKVKSTVGDRIGVLEAEIRALTVQEDILLGRRVERRR